MIFKRKKGGELMFGIAVASGCQSHDLTRDLCCSAVKPWLPLPPPR